MKRASTGYSGVDITLFPTMLVQGLIFQGKGSTVLAESHHTPTGAPLTSQPLSPTPRETIRQENRVPQPSSPPHTNVADEAASTVNTAGAEISTASPKVKIAGDSVDDIATESLVYIKRSAAKRKDKGKAIMEESSEPTQTKTKIQQEQESRGVNTFTPMESDDTVPKVATGSSKRSAAEELGEESFKRQKLYESCGVNHVSTPNGIDIFMLVEKEYPLSKGTLTLMLILKLMVEQDNEISKELIRKIFMQVERPRR
nr:hypothetical protein [Tanacetum cinerariifolium]